MPLRLRQINPTGKSLPIFRNSVKPENQKYSAFLVGQISGIGPPVSPERGAARDRHERCGEMRWTPESRRRTWPRRTAKTCGPDAPTLAPSLRIHSQATVARKPGHRGERAISRKPLRREGRMFSAEPVCSCAFCTTHGTRDRGCSAHPVFPAPSAWCEGETSRKPRASHAASMRPRALTLFDG